MMYFKIVQEPFSWDDVNIEEALELASTLKEGYLSYLDKDEICMALAKGTILEERIKKLEKAINKACEILHDKDMNWLLEHPNEDACVMTSEEWIKELEEDVFARQDRIEDLEGIIETLKMNNRHLEKALDKACGVLADRSFHDKMYDCCLMTFYCKECDINKCNEYWKEWSMKDE